MIDSGYESFSRQDIKRAWKNYYGSLKSYTYKENDDKEYYTQMKAKTAEEEIHSYLLADQEEVPVIFEVDLINTPSDIGEAIKKGFTKLAASVRLS